MGFDLEFRRVWQLTGLEIRGSRLLSDICYSGGVSYLPKLLKVRLFYLLGYEITVFTSLAPQLQFSHRTEIVCNDLEMQDAWPALPSSLLHRRSDCRPAATQHPAIGASIGQQMIRIPFDAASWNPDETEAAFNQTIWL
jgi:hypothetical protein